MFYVYMYLFQTAYLLTLLITLEYHLTFSHYVCLLCNFYCEFIFLFLTDSVDCGNILTGQ